MNNSHLSKYINCHEGESAIIFCPGKSIDDFKFDQNFDSMIKIGINTTIVHPMFKYRKLDYHLMCDPCGYYGYVSHPYMYENLNIKYNAFRGIHGNFDMINYDIRQWDVSITKNVVPYLFYSAPYVKVGGQFTEDPELMKDKPFSNDISNDEIIGNMSIIFPALQILLGMGFKKIYLVGVDIVGGYWFIDYGQGVTWEISKFRERWEYFEEWLGSSEKYNDVDIVSVNPVGLKGMFNEITL